MVSVSRVLTLSTTLVFALSARCDDVASSRSTQPSFLAIMADDLGYGDLGCYGHPTSSTPAIDRLAMQGMRFTQFYVASPVCSPSRAAFMTGRWPARVGVYCGNNTDQCSNPELSNKDGPCCNGVWLPGMPGGVPTTEKTIASLLQSNGYRTAAVGKWHLGGVPLHHPHKYGFDEYFGGPHGLGACPVTNCFCPSGQCGISGQSNWTGCAVWANTSILLQPADLRTVSTDDVNAALSFITRAAHSNIPFFQYYASHHVHSPQFAGSQTTNTTLRGKFGDSLAEFDDVVGRMVELVDTLGLGERTLVLLLSDNGPSLRNEIRGGNAGLLRCGKGTTFEGGSRVPMIARWTGTIQPFQINREVVVSLDLLPTILDVARVAPLKDYILDGFSVKNTLTNATSPTARNGSFVYYPQFPQKTRGVYSGIFAARAGKWKVHWCIQGTLQCGQNNTDHVCAPSQHYQVLDIPLAFNLDLDPSELYAIDVEDPDYAIAMEQTTKVAQQHASTMTWFDSPLLNDGPFDRRSQPCCNTGCTPFPACCNCDHRKNHDNNTCNAHPPPNVFTT